MRKFIQVLLISFVVFIFFWQFFFKGLFPIPSDTIIGLYHPFRDFYAKDYPNGIPFKNFLVTDPVRQQLPWRDLSVSTIKNMELPLWNPYNFSGTPLLANFQSAPFYMLNILFFIMPFATAWSAIIFLGPLLAGVFLYLYLANLNISKWASLLGAFTFSFSGFFVAWLEWGTITHVGLWLPLILLSIDKLVSSIKYQALSIKNRKFILWSLVYLFSLVSSFFAGHLQIFFYVGLFSFVYFICRWFQYGRNRKVLILYIILNTLYVMLTAVQWAPTLQFIFLSARGVDTFDFNNPGWFIPWQHLVQFIAPDFFGNPTTLNYWSVWNYGELVGYVGIIPLILALLAMFYRRDKKTLFFGTFFFLAIIFSFPTFFAKIPYILEVPFLSTSQPTRLLFVVDFTLAVLAALGFDYLLKTKKKIAVIYPLTFVAVIILILWIFTPKEHFQVIRSNLLLPTVILISASVLFILLTISAKYKRIVWIIYALIIMITLFDLLRFGWKFTPFTPKSYLFPSTKTISFLQNNLGDFRIMSTDSRVLPPNFSTMYRLKSVDGYDPLYLLRYGELIAASERRRADITPPFGFNRIITPQNYDSKIIDLMGVKYVLSLTGLSSKKLNKVFQEGETRIYENLNVVPRVFFASKLMPAKDKEEAIGKMFDDLFAPNDMAVVEGLDEDFLNMETITVGKSKIIHYSENKVVIETENSGIGFLILTDTFYPTWRVKIDEVKEKIYKTDYNFRGVVVPAGRHKIEFYNSLI